MTLPSVRPSPKTGTPIISFELPNADTEQWFLLTSDAHWDNPKCDRRLLKKHLDQAKDRGALVLTFGDWFCAMQGRYDPRRARNDIRPEHDVPAYLDALVETAVEWLEPYAQNLAMFTPGNHESSILKNCEVDLLKRLTTRLRDKGAPVLLGNYSGYLQFKITKHKTQRSSVNAFWHHGAGGGGPVTKGTIQANRRATVAADASIVLSGHVHEAWLVEYVRHRINTNATEYLETQTHVCLGGYKEEYQLGKGGFHVERGRPPKPVGGWWLRFFLEGVQPKWEFIRAT